MAERKKVLIVDKSPVFRNALKDVIEIEEPHADISEAQTVNQALDIAKNRSPDVVIFDIELPGNSGLDLLEKLSRLKPDTCIVVSLPPPPGGSPASPPQFSPVRRVAA